MSKTALITGGTGLVGSHCLEFLLASPEYASVTALVRNSTGIKHQKLREEIANFDRLGNMPSADDVFCSLGTTIKKAGSEATFRRVDFEYPLQVAEQSQSAGAKQFVIVSAVGANAKSANFYLRTKGELEDALRKLAFTGLHIFRPSFLVGERKEQRTGEGIGIAIAEALQFAMLGRLRKLRPVHANTVARAMVEAALRAVRGVQIYEYSEIKTLAQG